MSTWTRLWIIGLIVTDRLLGTHLVERRMAHLRHWIEEYEAHITVIQKQQEDLKRLLHVTQVGLCVLYLYQRRLLQPEDWLRFAPAKSADEEEGLDMLIEQLVKHDLEAGKPVHLFTDTVGCPIWVESLAAAVVELVGMNYTGVLHVAGAQPLSRYELGVRLLRFHGLDLALVIPALSRESGLVRPLNLALDCSRARSLLRTPLPGVDEVLQQNSLNREF
jgi:hypothetical protein